jgi:hypothetical protein
LAIAEAIERKEWLDNSFTRKKIENTEELTEITRKIVEKRIQ